MGASTTKNLRANYPRSEAEWDPTLTSETKIQDVLPITNLPACKGNQLSLNSIIFMRNEL
jgi:hypothetical protein